MKLFMLAAVALCACAPAPTVMHFDRLPPRVTVIVEDSSSVEKYCSARAIHADGGGWVPAMSSTLGCANPKTGVIHISVSHPEVLPHELAHLAGVADPDREGYAWPDLGTARMIHQ